MELQFELNKSKEPSPNVKELPKPEPYTKPALFERPVTPPIYVDLANSGLFNRIDSLTSTPKYMKNSGLVI